MASGKQIINVPLGQLPLITNADPKTGMGLTKAENVCYTTDGVLSKRIGTAQLPNITSTESTLAVLKDAPILFGTGVDIPWTSLSGSEAVVTYDNTIGLLDIAVDVVPASQKDVWLFAEGTKECCTYITKDTVADTYDTYVEYTYDAPRVRADSKVLVSSNSGHALPARLSANKKYYYFTSAGALYSGAVSSSFAAAKAVSGSPPTAKTGETIPFDVVYLSANQDMVVYVDGSDDLVYVTVDWTSGSPAAAYKTTAAGLTVKRLGVFKQTDTKATIVYVHNDGSNDIVRVLTIDNEHGAWGSDDNVETLAADDFVVNCTGVRASDADSNIFWTVWDSDVESPLVKTAYFLSAVTAGTPSVYQARGVISQKPFKADSVDTNTYKIGTYTQSWDYDDFDAQDTFYFTDEDRTLVGKALLGKARIYSYESTDAGLIPSTFQGDVFVSPASTTKFETCGLFLAKDDSSIDNKDLYTPVIFTIDTNPSVRAWAQGPDSLFIANSCPYEMDFSNVYEAGIPQYPEPISSTVAAGEGLGVGVYKYMSTYEHTSQGLMFRSAPSPEYTEVTTTSGSQQVDLIIPTATNTLRDGMQTVVYRTAVDGSAFYRVASINNNVDANVVTYTDSAADNDILSNELLYTKRGLLENISPGPTRVCCNYQTRFCYVDRENESSRIYYSSEHVPGVGTVYNDSLVLVCPSDGGKITGLYPLIDKLLIFKKNMIFATEGDGYNAQGGGENFVRPYMISPSVGLTDPNTIVRYPAGIMFCSENDVWQLAMNLQLQNQSAAVKYYLENYTVIGTASVPETNEVLFFTDTYTLVYNWLKNKWSTFTVGATSSVTADGKAYWINDDDNAINYYPSTTYDDNSSSYAMTVETSWLSFSQLGGYQHVDKILLVGQNMYDSKMRVSIGYDFDPVWKETQDYNAYGLTEFDLSAYYGAGLSTAYNYQSFFVELCPTYAECSSIRLKITDLAGTEANSKQAFSISSALFLVSSQGEFKLTEVARLINGA